MALQLVSSPWWPCACVFAGAFVGVTVGVPWVARAWRAWGTSDREPALRKLGGRDVPRAGGLAILLASLPLLWIAGAGGWLAHPAACGTLVGAGVVGCLGLVDDLIGVTAKRKLAVQLGAVALAIACGLRWPAMQAVVGPVPGDLVLAVFLLIALNAVNLIDGLDGLAAGLLAIAFGVVLSLPGGAGPLAPLAAIALGAVCGFLVHNRHPARVYLGDTGAYLLGFLAASLLVQMPGGGAGSLALPLAALAVPSLDLGFAVVRRVARGQSPLQADCDHVHHRLLRLGFQHRQVVILLWLAGMTVASLGLAVLDPAWLAVTGVSTLVALVLAGPTRVRTLLTGPSRTQGERRASRARFAALDHLEAELRTQGTERWRRASQALAPILRGVGVVAVRIQAGGEVIAHAGEETEAWGWLGLPMPGHPSLEVRFSLAMPPDRFQAAELALLERSVAVLTGAKPRQRARAAWPTARAA